MIVATLEPGLAWTVMATVEGGRRRRQAGIPVGADVAVAAVAAESAFALPRLDGAISPERRNRTTSVEC